MKETNDRLLRKPPWIKQSIGCGSTFKSTDSVLKRNKLNTVCEEAKCPNLGECWSSGTATFLILGDRCTRHCSFCSIKHDHPSPPDPGEPARIAKAANLTAMVMTLTPTVTNSVLYEIDIKCNGIWYLAEFTSDGTATAKEIVEGVAAAVNAAMPANTVVATEDDSVLVLTAEVKGQPFELGANAARWSTIAETTVTALTDINRCFQGITIRDNTQVMDDDGNMDYDGGSVMSVLNKGRMFVDTNALVAYGDRVYVRIAGTGDMGKLYNTQTAGEHIELDPKRIRWVKGLTASLGVVELM